MSFLAGILFLMLFVVLLGMAFIIGTYLKIKRKVTEVFGGKSRSADDRGGKADAGSSQSAPARSGKKIDPSVGEYVEFEEVQHYESTETDGRREVKFETEEQITDVEWEDVK